MLRSYRILYQVGFTPWERMTRSRPIGEQISALLVREEEGREPPYGQALDLGCGSSSTSDLRFGSHFRVKAGGAARFAPAAPLEARNRGL
jgi:hypothetical protein